MNYESYKNKEIAEIIDLIFGDGGLTKGRAKNSTRFQLRGDLTEDREHYDNYIIPVFNKNIMRRVYNRKVGIVKNKSKGFYGISTENNKLGPLLNFLGIKIGVKREMYIPEWIIDNKRFTISFLRGFLDSDGCVSCQKNYSWKPRLHNQMKISMGCCSKNLMKEIHLILKPFA